jgi:serine/threonine-protein kinase HipA
MSYVSVQAVSVYLWGRRVGVLAHTHDQYSVFEYDPEFQRSGLEIAPFMMPLSKSLYSADDFELPRRAFYGLPGVFADSLPDSFGNQLVKKWMV